MTLRSQFANLGELLADRVSQPTFEAIAQQNGVSGERLLELTNTLRAIETNKNVVPTLDNFTRVKVGKLTVPVSLIRHIELLAKFADVSMEAVWQLLMIETCSMYADRYSAIATTVNQIFTEEVNKHV